MNSKKEQGMGYLFDGGPYKSGDYDWDDLDIGALLNFYLFLNTDITQAEIAKELNLAPISVSRQIKNRRSRIKEEWKPILTRYIYQTDLTYLRKQIEVLQCIYDEKLFCEAEMSMYMVIDDYLKVQGFSNQMKWLSTSTFVGMVRYLNEATQKKWIFYIFPNGLTIKSSQDIMRILQSRFVDYRNGKRVEEAERRIILCGSEENFSRINNLWDADLCLDIDAKDEEWYLCHVDIEKGIIDAECRLK